MKAPIKYSRENQSYFYLTEFEMEIKADFKLLTPQELKSAKGGFIVNNICTTFFVAWANVN